MLKTLIDRRQARKAFSIAFNFNLLTIACHAFATELIALYVGCSLLLINLKKIFCFKVVAAAMNFLAVTAHPYRRVQNIYWKIPLKQK